MNKSYLAPALAVTVSLAISCQPSSNGRSEVSSAASTNTETVDAAADMAAVRRIVDSFGTKMKMVSLLAPSDMLRESVKTNYEAFVTPELLQQWVDQPTKAPGRTVSSPWPEKIVVERMESVQPGQYQVEGMVMYMTSQEMAHGGIADSSRVVLQLKADSAGNWRIASFAGDGEPGQ